MTLSRWFIFILLPEVYTRRDYAAFANFVAAINHTNSKKPALVQEVLSSIPGSRILVSTSFLSV